MRVSKGLGSSRRQRTTTHRHQRQGRRSRRNHRRRRRRSRCRSLTPSTRPQLWLAASRQPLRPARSWPSPTHPPAPTSTCTTRQSTVKDGSGRHRQRRTYCSWPGQLVDMLSTASAARCRNRGMDTSSGPSSASTGHLQSVCSDLKTSCAAGTYAACGSPQGQQVEGAPAHRTSHTTLYLQGCGCFLHGLSEVVPEVKRQVADGPVCTRAIENPRKDCTPSGIQLHDQAT